MANFLFVSTMAGSPWGGSEELWSQAALRLATMGHVVTASVCYWPERIEALERLRKAGCRTFRRRPSRLADALLKRLIKNPETWKARRWLQEADPNLVVLSCGDFAPDLSWCDACRQLGIPYATIAQSATEYWWPSDAVACRVREAYGRAHRSYFVSSENVRLVERMLGCRLLNARVVRNPFNVDYAVQCPFPEENGCWCLACVARLEPAAKGQDLLLEVLQQDKWRERSVKVSLFGNGHSAESVRHLASLYGLKDVAFCGHAENVEEIWRKHHLLVLPSRFEGLPLALVEAMLCARPAVVTNVAGNTEVIEDGETGFVAAAPTAGHLDEAMERAWRHRGDWRSMGVEAARRIRRLVPPDPAREFVEELLTLVCPCVDT
jgi:glycosyltransferase involved in cell wall biosynthesis